MTELVTIKGTSDGLVITLGDGPMEAVVGEMKTRLASRASFFRGGRVALHVGDRPLSVEQLQDIGQALEELGVTLWAVEADHPATQRASRELGLEVGLRTAGAGRQPEVEPMSLDEMDAYVVRRTLRSGQAVRYQGHVLVLGDVNPGAEIVAGGDVVVWGRLRGTAHAGAMGDESAVICALQMAPSQIRIGAQIARSPERGLLPKAPEKASVQAGRIVVERWNKGKTP